MTAMQWVRRMLGALPAEAHADDGQTMAEYGLILAGIAVIVMATVWLLGAAINATFVDIVAQF